jgi:Selenoprotein, putative
MLLRFLKTLLTYLRESAGENDYEHYRIRALARGESPAEPAEFYLSRLEQKYSRPNRCC